MTAICCESSQAETGVEKCDCAGRNVYRGGVCAGRNVQGGVCRGVWSVCTGEGCVWGLQSSVSREEGSKVYVCAKMGRNGERHRSANVHPRSSYTCADMAPQLTSLFFSGRSWAVLQRLALG